METVTIIAPHAFDESVWELLDAKWRGSFERWVIERGESAVFVETNPHGKEEYEPAELARVLELIPEPVFYSVQFRDIALCREVLAVLANDAELLVDNDFGMCVSGPEFVRLLRERPEWDWRFE